MGEAAESFGMIFSLSNASVMIGVRKNGAAELFVCILFIYDSQLVKAIRRYRGVCASCIGGLC